MSKGTYIVIAFVDSSKGASTNFGTDDVVADAGGGSQLQLVSGIRRKSGRRSRGLRMSGGGRRRRRGRHLIQRLGQ